MLIAWIVLAVVGVICLVLGRYAFPDDPPARVFYIVGFICLGVALILCIWWIVAVVAVSGGVQVTG